MSEITPIEYRDYQMQSRDAAFAQWEGGVDSTLLVLPTGTGKTVVAGLVIQQALEEHGWRTLYLAHREELINQGARTLRRFGFDTAIEMGGQDARQHAALLGAPDVVVGTVQTMQNDRLLSWPQEEFALVIVDEAHHAAAQSYLNILNWFHGYRLLGITATPDRGDDKNIGGVFATKCYEYSLRQAIASGWLARIETKKCFVEIDLRDIKTTGGDFNVGDLEERIAPKLEQIARAILAEHQDRFTVCFTPDVGSALGLAQLLTKLECPAEYVAGTGGDYGMSRAERRERLARFNRGEFKVLVNCDLLVEGWDCPQVACIAIVRPTRQRNRYCQMVGRGTRLCDGKPNCLILDFDWKTDDTSKDLCSVVELYDDGTRSWEVITAAKEIHAAANGEKTAEEAIEEAEEVVRVRKTLNLRVTGKSAQYKTHTFDPVGVGKILDIPLRKKYDLDAKGVNPASEGQLKFLKALGIEAPEGLSKWGASKMIDQLKKRQEGGLASVAQVKVLLENGVNPDLARAMRKDQALDAIQAIDRTRQATQGNLF